MIDHWPPTIDIEEAIEASRVRDEGHRTLESALRWFLSALGINQVQLGVSASERPRVKVILWLD